MSFVTRRTPGLSMAMAEDTSFPFTSLPFEMQKEVFQYLLVAADDQIIRPEKSHGIDNKACFEKHDPIFKQDPTRGYAWYYAPAEPPSSLPCYHKTLETQLLTVSQDVNAVAIQVLYGCNHFHFSAASRFNKFTNDISPLGVQSLRYLAIDYPLPRSFQVSSLRRLVMGTDILDLQILELNMLNANKERTPIDVRRGSGWRKSRRWNTSKGPSLAAERLVDLLDGLKETESVGNNEILIAVNEKFDVNRADVETQLEKATKLVESGQQGWYSEMAQYCKVKLIRKSK